MTDGVVTTATAERSSVALGTFDAAPRGGAADDDGQRSAGRRPRWRPTGPILRRALGLALIVGVVAGAAGVRAKAAEARRAAADARAEATEATTRRRQAEAQVASGVVALEGTYGEAAAATAAREAQRARLVELQLVEETLDEAVASARRDTEAIESERDGLDHRVQQQAVDLPQLEGCLAEVRPLVDTAFLATVNPGLTVPSISPACRALLDAVSGSG